MLLLQINKTINLNKILVLQTASIGDVILATPVIEQLHKDYPEAKIHFLLKKGIEGVFLKHPFLNEVLIWDKGKNKYSNYLNILKRVRAHQYDLVVNIQRFFTSGLMTALSGARFKAGFDKNPFSYAFTHKVKHVIGSKENPVHEAERNLSLIKSFISGGAKARVKLYPDENDYQALADYAKGKYITIAPASLWFTKQLPAEKWQELIRSIGNTTSVYLLGSKADTTLCEKLVHDSGKANLVNLAGKLSFLQSAALMEKAMMNFVNDSAPMHLASAVNAPVAAIYCSTVTSFGFGPLSDKSVIIETEQELACRPCGLHGKPACPEQHFKCAKTIKLEQFLRAMK